MILHTVMPAELVWADAERLTDAVQGGGQREYVLRDGARRIWIGRGGDGRACVLRLSSTEPRDYLNPRWRPGAPWPG